MLTAPVTERIDLAVVQSTNSLARPFSSLNYWKVARFRALKFDQNDLLIHHSQFRPCSRSLTN